MRPARKLFLPLFLVVTLVAIFLSPLPAAPAEDVSGRESTSAATRLIVYSFHGRFRCVSCLRMEEYTRAALDENFSDELNSGRIVLRVVNRDEPENRHFSDDYKLTSSAVVLSLTAGGKEIRYKDLEKLRDLVNDRQAFTRHLFTEMESFLAAP